MELSTIFAGISTLVSITALAISISSDWKRKKLDLQLKEQALELNKREEENEKKAEIEVNTVSLGKGSHILKFYNKGKAIARNISFNIVSAKKDEICLFIQDDYLPYPRLHPQQNFDVKYMSYSNNPHETIHIAWDDDYGTERTKEIVVDM